MSIFHSSHHDKIVFTKVETSVLIDIDNDYEITIEKGIRYCKATISLFCYDGCENNLLYMFQTLCDSLRLPNIIGVVIKDLPENKYPVYELSKIGNLDLFQRLDSTFYIITRMDTKGSACYINDKIKAIRNQLNEMKAQYMKQLEYYKLNEAEINEDGVHEPDNKKQPENDE